MSKRSIKVGDYIEGFEEIGPVGNVKVKKTRIIVSKVITEKNGNKLYEGQADDSYRGARGTMISEELGEIRVITDEVPFTHDWWVVDTQIPTQINITAQNRAVIMTEDKKCILRGTPKTRYELCLVNEKSRRQIRETRGVLTAEQIVKYNHTIYLSDVVKEYYGTDSGIYNFKDTKIPKLIGVKAKKFLVIE